MSVPQPCPRVAASVDAAVRVTCCNWAMEIELDPSGYGLKVLRQTKVSENYRKSGNLRAVQLLLGHTKADRTVRYLGVELEDAPSIAERIDI